MSDFWTRLKNHLNESLYETKRRKDILNELRENDPLTYTAITEISVNGTTIRGSEYFNGFSIATFDTYINYLFQAGYLYKPRRGHYGLTTVIPSDLSISDVKLMAYGERTGEFIGIARATEEPLPVGISMNLRVVKNRSEFFKEEEFEI